MVGWSLLLLFNIKLFTVFHPRTMIYHSLPWEKSTWIIIDISPPATTTTEVGRMTMPFPWIWSCCHLGPRATNVYAGFIGSRRELGNFIKVLVISAGCGSTKEIDSNCCERLNRKCVKHPLTIRYQRTSGKSQMTCSWKETIRHYKVLTLMTQTLHM